MKRHRNLFIAILFFCVIPLILGCAHNACEQERPERGVEIVKGPAGTLSHDLRLGIFDFINPTRIEDLGYHCALRAHRALLQSRFFESIERVHQEFCGLEEAVSIGQALDYDLILIGEVEEFTYGGVNADSAVTISLRILAPYADETIWYLVGSRDNRPKKFLDFILVWRESEEAVSPYLLTDKLIDEMIGMVATAQGVR